MALEAAVAPAFEGTPASVPAPVPIACPAAVAKSANAPGDTSTACSARHKVDVDAFADHFDKFGQHPAPEAKAYAIRENDGASLSMGHFKQTETLLPLLVIRRPIAAMIVADETDGLVVADDAPRQDMVIGRTSVGLGGRR